MVAFENCNFNVGVILLFCFLIIIESVSAENILGCNGFIKSDFPIDFSKIEIKLLSKERNLKDRTECAPNNGYYFLPLYDSGEYILSVTSQDNWSFEPTEVKVKFDRVSDPCSKGEDINFHFKGFSISGQVDNINGKTGPSGVTITLLANLRTEQKELISINTNEGGMFKLSRVPPGSYTIKASHARWKLSKNAVTFEVKDNNYIILPQSLLLSGYDVTGMVVSDKEPISQVHFVLFSPKNFKVDVSSLIGCEMKNLEGFNVTDGILLEMKQLCFVTSDDNGSFVFPSIPTGSYVIVPFYRSLHPTKFDVHPNLYNINVDQDSVLIRTPFQVVGFSVKGRVLHSKITQKPLPNVKVQVPSLNISTFTDMDGFYVLEGMKSGSFDFQFESGDVVFADDAFKISPNSPVLPDVYPHSFKVSGLVKTFGDSRLQIKFRRQHDNEVFTTEVESSGYFEKYLPTGRYVVSVESLPEYTLPVWFSSLNETFVVEDSPVTGIEFVQVKADLVGSVNFGTDFDHAITISMRDVSKNNIVGRATTNKDGKYMFKNLLPGEYELALMDTRGYCWESIVHTIRITDEHSVAPEFRTSGVLFILYTTHDTNLNYVKLPSNVSSLEKDVLAIKQGVQKFCLPGWGIYNFKAVSCHTFQKSSFTWTPGDMSVHLTAVSHAFVASVISNTITDDLYINVYAKPDTTLKSRLGPLKNYTTTNGRNEYVYTFEIQVAPNEQLAFVPQSTTLLFTPTSYDIIGTNDCVRLNGGPFTAKQGLRFEGQIKPPIAGVQVTIVNGHGEIITSIVTEGDGKFKFNPLQPNEEYVLTAHKEGYVFTGPSKDGIFNAKKLAEIIVQVEDDDNVTLPRVLISLSGGESYRQTSQTNENGEISFTSLQPGEYYTRPVLKEYKFVPPHKVVTIFEGITLKIPFKAHRVLYSTYGNVFSLNGVPEKGVAIEAVGKTDGLCVQLQEEASSEENGSFRIRGLQPQCSYNVRVKLNDELNLKIQKVIPESVYIQMNNTDVRGINLRLVPKLTFTDISVMVSVSEPDFMRTLTIKLYRGRGDDELVSKVSLNDWWKSTNNNDDYYSLTSVVLAMPAVPTNGENYYVRLDSSLRKKTYAYTSSVAHFVADRSFHLIRLSFRPQPKQLTTTNETKNSYSTAVLIILSVISYWYREAIINALQGLPYVSITTPEFLNRLTRRFNPKEEVVVNNFMEFEEPSLTVVKRKIRARRIQ